MGVFLRDYGSDKVLHHHHQDVAMMISWKVFFKVHFSFCFMYIVTFMYADLVVCCCK